MKARIFSVIFFLITGVLISAQINKDLEILMKAYPGAFEIQDDNHIVFPDGTVIIYDDKIEKTFEEKLAKADIEDMMSLIYPLGPLKRIPPFQYDPGRFRAELFFQKLYGSTAEEVGINLEVVEWMPGLSGKKLRFTRLFGVADKMKAIIAELEKLPDADKFYLSKSGGSWNFRYIAGTEILSFHSFAIAVDIRVDVSHYWRWEKTGAEVYKNNIPYSIVKIFEKYGFIWGGKWSHFDTMHFEYRPELMLKAGAVIEGFETDYPYPGN